MVSSISVTDKRKFLQWFLKNYNIKRWQNLRILNYMISNIKLLENIHFVRETSYCPRHLTVMNDNSQELSFRYYKDTVFTMDRERIFHDIRFNIGKPLYIQFKFINSKQNAYYAAVLEENPYAPQSYLMNSENNLLAERLLAVSYYDYKRDELKQKLDQALDDRDQTKFIELSTMLNLLESKYM